VRELRSLQLALAEIEADGGAVVAVSKDSPAELARLAQEEGLTFLLLSDPGLELVDELGLRHAGADWIHGGDLARPAVLFFDSRGELRDSFLTDNWRRRLRPEEAVDRIRALD
jgi:peroxiredoxin